MNIAIVGATGNVGRKIIEILEKKQINIENLFLLASKKSEGKKVNYNGKEHTVAAVENFDFGILYNFPFQSPGAVFSPSIFELFVTFDFSIYRRNRRGQYNRLQTDNYF